MVHRRKREIKAFPGWLLIVFSATIIVIILVNYVAEPYLKNQIKKILTDPGSDHRISVENTGIHWLNAGVTLNNIRISPENSAENIQISGEVRSIKISGIKILKAAFAHEFDAENIIVSGVSVRVDYTKSKNPQAIIIKDPLNIGTVKISELSAEIHNPDDSVKFIIKDLNASFEKLRISESDTFSVSSLNLNQFSVTQTVVVPYDSLNTTTVYGLRYSVKTKTMSLDSLSVVPKFKGRDYTDRFSYETDRIELYLSRVQIPGIDPASLIDKAIFRATLIRIGAMKIDVFRDKGKPFRHLPAKMPQDILYNFPGMIHIDSLYIDNGNVTYSELAEKETEPGIIFFRKIRMSAKTISNHSMYKNGGGWLLLKGSALLMGQSQVNVTLRARLFDPNNRFEMSGKLGAMDLDVLNAIIERNESMRLSGKIVSMEFGFIADNKNATGRLTFLYDGLKVDIKDKNGFLRDRINTWLLNFSIMNSNPLPDEKTREGVIDYKRDPERFIFNYSIKALMTGIRSTITTE